MRGGGRSRVPPPGRNVKGLIRYALGACLGIVVLLLLFGKRGELIAALHQIARANPTWVLVAAAAEAGSVLAFAHIQHRTLKLSGTKVTLRAMTALSLANDAIANTIPGEPVVSSAYRYRYYRRRGATGASAGWTIFTILIAQAIGMSLILLFGVLVALLGNAPREEHRDHDHRPRRRDRRRGGPGPPRPDPAPGRDASPGPAPRRRRPPSPPDPV